MQKSNRYLIAVVAALGLIPVVLDTTIVTVALGPIRGELHTDVNSVQWIVTAFFLTTAALVVVGGYLANRFGRKRVFILGLAVFTLGSVLCGLSPTIDFLIAFRVLQGIGGGVLTTVGVTVAFDAFPKEERAKASAVVGVPALLAPIFGPILGGYLNDTFSWHSIFFVNLPVGIVAIALALLVLPNELPSAQARGARFDYIGLALSILGVIAIVYGFTLVTQTNPASVTAANPAGDLYGWGYWLVWTLIGVGLAVLGVFALYSLFVSRDPALDLRQFARYDFLMSNLFSWSGALITFGLLVLLPLYFELVRLPHLSALDTGVALVPLGAGSLAGVIVASILYRLIGPRWVVFSGAVLAALSAWQFARIVHPTAGAAQIVASVATHTPIPSVAGPDDLRWWMFALGLGFMMINISVQTLALEALKGEALAKATSLVASTKLIFSSIGVAILTTILTSRTRSRATDLAGQLHALAAGAPGGSGAGAGAGSALSAIQAQLATQAGAWAIQGIFWLICFGSLGLIALALLLPGRRRKLAEPDEQPASEPISVGA